MTPELPAEVQAFLAAHIRSLDDLYLLIAIMQSADRWWDADEASRELHITPRAARRVLDHLAQHNLLDLRITDDVHYQFRPGTEQLRSGARACAEAHRSQPLALARLVARPRRGISDFADAFRLRRDDDDR